MDLKISLYKQIKMKFSTLLLLFTIIILGGCTCNNNANTEQTESDSTNEVIETDSTDLGPTITNIPPLWKVEEQSDHSEKLTQPDSTKGKVIAPDEMIKALNESYPEIQLDLTKISNDTVYINIPNSQYLSDKIGNTGAYNYLATAVYNLTELKNIKFVHFTFKEGEHASPGTYKRSDFSRLR